MLLAVCAAAIMSLGGIAVCAAAVSVPWCYCCVRCRSLRPLVLLLCALLQSSSFGVIAVCPIAVSVL